MNFWTVKEALSVQFLWKIPIYSKLLLKKILIAKNYALYCNEI